MFSSYLYSAGRSIWVERYAKTMKEQRKYDHLHYKSTKTNP